MSKVYLTNSSKKKNSLRHYILDEMKDQKFTQSDMGRYLGLTQQAFSYKVRNSSFSYTELLTIFDVLKTPNETKVDLLTCRKEQ